ncbi:DeoR family transcriptional regulator [[Pantoea] beijingensis]|uniref:DeoR family transcriptional regulator n=1 Tax=[Pantoea] beijingensis TaxID=1324864 RepID=A0A443IBT7_9GAMM|nr:MULTISPECIES: DeoR/GlpR family DNA-binding transcription regulator [Erwiniaceae]RWR01450.1 DeoR family transcriptional regulator [[Pantoea] beijingensis]
MLPIERQQQILAMVTEKGVISLMELMECFQVSHMTIRRDIQKLESLNAIAIVSGGIALPERQRLLAEPSHQDKTVMYPHEKEAIGRAAAQLIPMNSSIYLDAGTTTLALAHALAGRDDLLVVTNDFVIAAFITEHTRCQMVHTGGTLCRENRSCVGTLAAAMLQNLFIDIAFISAACWNERGISTPHEDKVAVKQAVAKISSRRVLLADASKYGKIANYLALPLSAFDSIISDEHLPATAIAHIHDRGIELHQA